MSWTKLVLQRWLAWPEFIDAVHEGMREAHVRYVPERTCRVESSHEEEFDQPFSLFEHELSCGHSVSWDCELPSLHCPDCGARVVGCDDA